MFILSLTLCMSGNVACFCCRLLTFFSKHAFSKYSLRNTIRVSNNFDTDQYQHYFGAVFSLLSVKHKRSTFSYQVNKI